MNRNHSDLLTLLKLLSGELTAAEGQSARQRIADERRFRQRWREVSQIWDEPDCLDHYVRESELIPAELTAGFIDGGLSEQELRRVETTCWKSGTALRGVVHAYRIVSADDPVDAVPVSLTDRLMQIPREGVERGTGLNGASSNTVAAAGQRTARPVMQDRRPPRTGTVRKRQSRDRSTSRFVWLGGAALLLVVALSVLAVVNNREPIPDRVIAQPDTPVVPEQNDASTQRDNESVVVDGSADSAVVEVGPGVQELVPDSPPQPNYVDPGPGEPVATEATTITWASIDGLLAVRSDQQPLWRAAEVDWRLESECELAVLAGSRVEGQMLDGVGILLGSDSRLTMVPAVRSAGFPIVSLEWGHLALSGLKRGTSITGLPVVAGGVLEVERDGTSVAVEQSGVAGRLYVVSGEVSLEGRSFAARSSLVLDSGMENPVLSAAMPPAWLSDAQQPLAMDDQTLVVLSKSDNLVRDLEALMHETSDPNADTIVAWNLTLAPDTAAVSSLNADEHVVRVAALNWLAQADVADPRRRAAWRAYAGTLGESEMSRQIATWFRAAHEPTRADRQLFAGLLRGLEHPAVSVRETADFCLKRITGMSVASYRADAVPAERRQGILRWRAVVARIAGAALWKRCA